MKIRSTGGGLRHGTVLAAAGTLNLALMGGPAHAQTAAATADTTRVAEADSRSATTADSKDTALEEIIVTAERRTIDVQRIPASVSVRTGDELTAQGRYTTVQILQDIPGVLAVSNNSNNTGSADVQGNNITIRGISAAVSGAGGGPSPLSATPETAVYVDGVYEGIGSNYDLERVEVLRGPQGTLYGRSATAGVVAFHTRDPILDSFDGNAEAEVGNYDLRHYGAAANLPVGSTLAVRVAADYRDQGEGYFNEADRGMGSTLSGRVKVLWKPLDDLSLLAGVAYERDESDSGGKQSTVDTTHLGYTIATTSSSVFPGYKQQRQYWAELNWDMGPAVLTYQPAFRTWYQNDDRLQTPNFIGSNTPLEQTILTPLDQFHSEELRLASKDTAVGWQVGAFYYRNQLHTSDNTFLATPSNSVLTSMAVTDDQKDTKDMGVFGETTFSPISSLRATLGVRYDSTRVETSEYYFNNPFAFCGTFAANSPGFMLPPGVNCTGPGQANVPPPPGSAINNVAITFHNFNYKARIEYDLAPRNMVYGMVSTGFKPGDVGIYSPGNGVYAPNILAAEKLTSFELGSKNRFLDDSLQLNFALYYYNYGGFQTTYRVHALDISPIPVTVPARNVGAEVESLYRITALDRVGLNYAYVESRWKNEPAAFEAAYPQKVRALIPNTVTGYYEHTFNLPGGSTLMARIDGQYYSPHLTDNLHADLLALGQEQYVETGSHAIGNLSGTWTSQDYHLSVTAYVRNFTNERYTTYMFQGSEQSFGADWNDPRIYGVMVSAHF
ncbi:MAG: TonB-dependent receptor [Gammaproteobacteria bacterium]|nr:TonB-dependent receptor [Gammaproteobacteria bacterium]